MRPITIAAIVAALVVAGCATREKPSDCLTAAGQATSAMQRPEQTAQNIDTIPGVAIADTSANAISAPQAVGVEVQAQNQNSGPQVSFALFDVREAMGMLTHTSPAEAYVVKALDDARAGSAAIARRLDNDPTLTPTDRTALEGRQAALDARVDALLARLDRYAEAKVNAAKAILPDLSALQSIAYNFTDVLNQASGAAEYPHISDDQARAIQAAATVALSSRPGLPATAPTPPVAPDDETAPTGPLPPAGEGR